MGRDPLRRKAETSRKTTKQRANPRPVSNQQKITKASKGKRLSNKRNLSTAKRINKSMFNLLHSTVITDLLGRTNRDLSML